MFVIVDQARCTGLGICESLAPDTFEIADDGSLTVLRDEFVDADRQAVEEAVRSCPTEALRLAEARA